MTTPVDLTLPPPAELERRSVALAMLDAVLSPEWEFRHHSFNRRWDEARGSRMASRRDGSGDGYFVLFFAGGAAAIKGFVRASPALAGRPSVAGVLDGIRDSFGDFTNEPAFSPQSTSFALWCERDRWQRSGSVPASVAALDGSSDLLRLLRGTPEEYAAWAEGYFETAVDAGVVARFFRHEPLTLALARALQADADLDALADDIEEIGYPVG